MGRVTSFVATRFKCGIISRWLRHLFLPLLFLPPFYPFWGSVDRQTRWERPTAAKMDERICPFEREGNLLPSHDPFCTMHPDDLPTQIAFYPFLPPNKEWACRAPLLFFLAYLFVYRAQKRKTPSVNPCGRRPVTRTPATRRSIVATLFAQGASRVNLRFE